MDRSAAIIEGQSLRPEQQPHIVRNGPALRQKVGRRRHIRVESRRAAATSARDQRDDPNRGRKERDIEPATRTIAPQFRPALGNERAIIQNDHERRRDHDFLATHTEQTDDDGQDHSRRLSFA